MGLRLNAHGKINLTLDVLGRRPDGYHQVEMIMQSIGLHDTLEFAYRPGEIVLDVSGVPVTAGEDNLVFKAARLLRQYAGEQAGALIRLHKEIPVAAGLAGGSSNAAAALRGLNRLWQLGLTDEQLSRLAVRLGADVPFCLLGGTAIARGVGELLTPLPPAPRFGVVLVKPPFGVSTAEVYRNLNLAALGSRPDTAAMAESLRQGDLSRVAANLCNVLESVTIKWHPQLQQVKEALLAAGCLGVLMSGSGPTVFGLTEDEAAAASVARRLVLPDCQILASVMI
ncbi:4-(cytidine 5'-diphospho)-2-C-methyl-D-erythritol kinase [Desulforamulus hydrothermalis]|uniref:4-diphosphocytidyl-2-C-methyl-D-erythritol kinase n=1 Tax=Desulforamulus hydrothermalis Lam5 = DSM 18033 TaxID=1121428 RepID=K8DZP4_9FIRM|nr:4-(cytidine 5'-diphospho)-2-C-methyl-D-erythritol kinase [Desulforamulus hydrothermalis]CCO08602.1 4-diphosphocytidyl-2-C-methyl-D-erythritol kinase [Desulforamulus hydrothermalis Lam5 = DSM 18033]SHH01383.1 4-diphosphocytidyl-2-C-methyl-D-erythritol kinase [Desulforamulus hydrothermalis Lam5 = DSM 18033]